MTIERLNRMPWIIIMDAAHGDPALDQQWASIVTSALDPPSRRVHSGRRSAASASRPAQLPDFVDDGICGNTHDVDNMIGAEFFRNFQSARYGIETDSAAGAARSRAAP